MGHSQSRQLNTGSARQSGKKGKLPKSGKPRHKRVVPSNSSPTRQARPRPPSLRADPMPVRTVLVRRDGKGSLGFMFSTNKKAYNDAINHFVSVVDQGGPAHQAGLHVGDRILQMNGVDVTRKGHNEVVDMVRAVQPNASLKLLVSIPNDLIVSTLKRHASNRVSTTSSMLVSHGAPATAWAAPPTIVTTVVRHQPSSKYLLVQRKGIEGWDLFGHSVGASDPPEATAVRVLSLELGFSCRLTGVLRIEYGTSEDKRTRVVYLADVPSDMGQTQVNLPPSSQLSRAKWFTLQEAISAYRSQSAPARDKVRSASCIDWLRYVQNKGLVVPPSVFVRHGAPIEADRRAAAAAAIQHSSTAATVQLRSTSKSTSGSGTGGGSRRRSSSSDQPRVSFPPPPSDEGDQLQAAEIQQARAAVQATVQHQEEANSQRSASATAAYAQAERTTSILSTSTSSDGSKRKKDGPRSVSFSDGHQVERTYSKEDYDRVLDAGDFNDLRALFEHNEEQMEKEQTAEMESMLVDKRVRAFYIKRGGRSDFGFKLGALQKKPPYELTVPVVFQSIEAGSPLIGNIQEGDRLLKINGQWVPTMQHAKYLLEVLANATALDLTITRDEPLPPYEEVNGMENKELKQAIFDHYGIRLLIGGKRGWAREDVVNLLQTRFLPKGEPPSPAAASSSSSSSGPSSENEGDPDQTQAKHFNIPSRPAPAPPTASSAANSSAKRRVKFSDSDPEVSDTFTTEEYSRALDPGEGFASLRDLFARNNDELEHEQEQEAIRYVEEKRLRGVYVLRQGANTFGIKVKPLPRDVSSDYMFLEGVVVDSLADNSPIKKEGTIQVGDRIVRVNGKWILNHQHAEFLLHQLLRRAPALDITITRGEPLPPCPDLYSMSDQELEQAAFEHCGTRLLVDEHSGKSRDQVIADLRKRFANSEEVAMTNLTDDMDDEEC